MYHLPAGCRLTDFKNRKVGPPKALTETLVDMVSGNGDDLIHIYLSARAPLAAGMHCLLQMMLPPQEQQKERTPIPRGHDRGC